MRSEPRTLSELASELSITRNAVVVQVNQLLNEGIIRQGRQRRAATAGKPAYEYEAAPGSEDHASAAYQPFATALLSTLRRKLPDRTLTNVLRQTGLEIAQNAPIPANGTFNQKLNAAIGIVNSLGASAEVTQHSSGKLIVRNHACPFATAVRQDACVCRAAAAFFEGATGRKVRAACIRKDLLTCQYIIEQNPSAD